MKFIGTTHPVLTRSMTGRVLAAAAAALTVTAALVAVAGPAGAVSLTEASNSPVIATQGPNNSLDFSYQSGGVWHVQQVAGAGTTYSAPSLAQTEWGPVIAAEGPSNSLD